MRSLFKLLDRSRWNTLCFLVLLVYAVVVSARTTLSHLPCQPEDRLQIAAVGDILLHLPLQRRASYAGFQSLWSAGIPYIKAADLAVANVEGPMAFGIHKSGKLVKDPGPRVDGQVYSSYPLFNYHPKLAMALKKSGFDLIATANNHALDRDSVGVDRTIQTLNFAKLHYTGTRAQSDTAYKWYTITEKKGYRIAWLACTAHTNGIQDKHKQVLYCYKKTDQKRLLNTITQLSKTVDAVILLPHWGKQYQHGVGKKQQHLARAAIEAGALAVLGTHPHVVQPIKFYNSTNGKRGLIAYSLGNFVSNQGTPKNRSAVILYLSLKKTDRQVEIADVGYVPIYMQNRSGFNNIGLKILGPNDKETVGYRILSRVLGSQNLLMGETAVKQYLCRGGEKLTGH